MNYKIINDEQALLNFIEWLPELKNGQKYYLSLFARKKYCPDLVKSNDKTQLKRFVSDKGRMLQKIKQLQCEDGSYLLKDSIAPQESLVLYINPNPRDMKKATYSLIKQCVKLLENNNLGYNVHAEAMSCIQKSKAKTHFCDFDIDSKDIDLTKLEDILPREAYDILETRGGYHVLVNTAIAKLVPMQKWHTEIRRVFDVDHVGDQFIPVPGCCQGGFVPKFL